jgi:hypothetical protein
VAVGEVVGRIDLAPEQEAPGDSVGVAFAGAGSERVMSVEG